MRSIAIIVLSGFLCGQAVAQEVQIGRPDAKFVAVWKDADAQARAFDYIRENGPNETTFRIVVEHMTACLVSKGTRAIILGRSGLASFRIEIVDGIHRGCRGVIQEEDKGHG